MQLVLTDHIFFTFYLVKLLFFKSYIESQVIQCCLFSQIVGQGKNFLTLHISSLPLLFLFTFIFFFFQLRREKVELENALEQEQESLVNRLWKRMDKLEAEKRLKHYQFLFSLLTLIYQISNLMTIIAFSFVRPVL